MRSAVQGKFDDDRDSDDESSNYDELIAYEGYRTYRSKTIASSLSKHPLDGRTIIDIIHSAFRVARRQERGLHLEDINNHNATFYQGIRVK